LLQDAVAAIRLPEKRAATLLTGVNIDSQLLDDFIKRLRCSLWFCLHLISKNKNALSYFSCDRFSDEPDNRNFA
jgi:hypothetical protein